MEKFVKHMLIQGVKNDFIWKLLQPLSTIGIFLTRNRKAHENQFNNEHLKKKYFGSLEVQNGPFKGMKYPRRDFVRSAIYPKLLGSYERELWKYIEKMKGEKYSEIIDVGCAEGYYAIGLALNTKGSKIYAYDIDEKARTFCHEMASLNGVLHKVSIRPKLTGTELENFEFTGKGLIICDCEGFEKQLFTINNIDNIKKCDLLIETHDFKDIGISTYLKQLFKETHHIESIVSVDDIQKVLTYDFEILNDFSLQERKHILSERRPAIMEWLLCTSKM